MQDVTEQEKVIAKVRALLRKTPERGATQEEAAAAAAAAQRLMQKYNLELAHVREESGATEPEFVKETDRIGHRAWRRSLMHHVAKANFCRTCVTYSAGKRGATMDSISLIGERHNIEATRVIYAYLERTIRRLADEGYLHYNTATPFYPLAPMTWKNSFYTGAVRAIAERLAEQTRAFRGESTESRALVVVTDEQLNAALNRFFPGNRTTTARLSFHNSAYGAGHAAGSTISLTPVRELTGK